MGDDWVIDRFDASEIVHRCRLLAGITQSELADRIGTTQPVVSRWERGHDEPRLSTLTEVAASCSVALTLRAEPHHDSVDRAQLRQNLALSPDERLAAVTNLGALLAAARVVPS